MEFSHYAIILLALGMGLLIAEVFIPSGGLILGAALISIAASIWFAWSAWWESNPTAWWVYVAALLVLLPSSLGGAFYVFPRTALGRRFLLEGPELDEVTPYVEHTDRLSRLVGRGGSAVTDLSPGGLVMVEGERLHAESEGVLIDAGEQIEVIALRGNRVLVRRTELSQSGGGTRGTELPRDVRSADAPLDFDLPQG
jgi:membrane-bound ClpP family serine protease